MYASTPSAVSKTTSSVLESPSTNTPSKTFHRNFTEISYRSGDIQYVTTRLDLLSHTAFYQEEVRKSVWQEPFTHWVPLYLNGGHGDRAYPLLVQEIEGLYSKPFEPMLVMDLFAKLMNTMVVSVMNGSTHGTYRDMYDI